MEGLLELLNEALPQDWLENTQHLFGSGLTDDMIVQSVQEASDFFNMEIPNSTYEDWTTGVMTGVSSTPADDILIFNREQMTQMGITDKEGFDLVMTHEGAHRALQNLDTGFSSHQEELCCDYMAGVRAGLNGMDEQKMANSLNSTSESATHPEGKARVAAIEEGVTFAHEFMEAHDKAPTFTECLEHFEQTEVYAKSQVHGLVTLTPEQDKDTSLDAKVQGALDRADAVIARAEELVIANDADLGADSSQISFYSENHTYIDKARNEHHLAELAEQRGDYEEMREHNRLEKAYMKMSSENHVGADESTLKAYSQEELKRKVAHAEKEKGYYEGLVRHHTYMANHGLSKADTDYHLSEANKYQARANECASEARKWQWTKPDKK